MWRSPGLRWGMVLGFALGGFFDGILLHQILQWHHLLSLVPGIDNLRMQVLWDGWFHALMYVVAALGLWGLWRAHRRGESASGRRLFAALTVGFGLWHVIDTILSHWLLGIHRIRLDSDNPLLWDLIWLVAFGIVPLAAAWLMLHRGGGGPSLRGSAASLVLLAILTTAAGAWALSPPAAQPFTTIVFRPGLSEAAAFAALAQAEARLVWADGSMGVVVAEVAPDRRWSFYGHGALLVSGSGLPAACFDWVRA